MMAVFPPPLLWSRYSLLKSCQWVQESSGQQQGVSRPLGEGVQSETETARIIVGLHPRVPSPSRQGETPITSTQTCGVL